MIDITPEAIELLVRRMTVTGYAINLRPTLSALSAANEDAYLRGFSAGQAALKNAGEFVVIDSPELAELRAALTKNKHLLKMQKIATEMANLAWDQTSAALTASQAETAAAYAGAEHALSKWAVNLRDMNFPDTAPIVEQCAAMIRALTTKAGVRVQRSSIHNVVVVDGIGYDLRDCTEKAYAMTVASGTTNPAFDMPGWFFSGSPFADQIKALGAIEVPIPENFTVEWVPDLGKVWRSRQTIWETYIRTAHPPADSKAARDRMIADAVRPYQEALIFCSGSVDFGEGGVARVGWNKLCAPLIAAIPKGGE